MRSYPVKENYISLTVYGTKKQTKSQRDRHPITINYFNDDDCVNCKQKRFIE